MDNLSDKTPGVRSLHFQGIEFFSVPDYHELYVSRCGHALNALRMRLYRTEVLWSEKRMRPLGRTLSCQKLIDGKLVKSNISIQRAVALTFVPVPQELAHLSKESLLVSHNAPPGGRVQAHNVKWVTTPRHQDCVPVMVSGPTYEKPKRFVSLHDAICHLDPSVRGTHAALVLSAKIFRALGLGKAYQFKEHRIVLEAA